MSARFDLRVTPKPSQSFPLQVETECMYCGQGTWSNSRAAGDLKSTAYNMNQTINSLSTTSSKGPTTSSEGSQGTTTSSFRPSFKPGRKRSVLMGSKFFMCCKRSACQSCIQSFAAGWESDKAGIAKLLFENRLPLVPYELQRTMRFFVGERTPRPVNTENFYSNPEVPYLDSEGKTLVCTSCGQEGYRQNKKLKRKQPAPNSQKSTKSSTPSKGTTTSSKGSMTPNSQEPTKSSSMSSKGGTTSFKGTTTSSEDTTTSSEGTTPSPENVWAKLMSIPRIITEDKIVIIPMKNYFTITGVVEKTITIRVVGLEHNQMSEEDICILKGQYANHNYSKTISSELPLIKTKVDITIVYGTMKSLPSHLKRFETPLISYLYKNGIQKELGFSSQDMEHIAKEIFQSVRPLLPKGGYQNYRTSGAFGTFENLSRIQPYIKLECPRFAWAVIPVIISTTLCYLSYMGVPCKKNKFTIKEAGRGFAPSTHGGMINFADLGKKKNKKKTIFFFLFFFLFS